MLQHVRKVCFRPHVREQWIFRSRKIRSLGTNEIEVLIHVARVRRISICENLKYPINYRLAALSQRELVWHAQIVMYTTFSRFRELTQLVLGISNKSRSLLLACGLVELSTQRRGKRSDFQSYHILWTYFVWRCDGIMIYTSTFDFSIINMRTWHYVGHHYWRMAVGQRGKVIVLIKRYVFGCERRRTSHISKGIVFLRKFEI